MPDARTTDCAAPAPPTFTILMATHQGARYLPAQLASLAAQTDRDWRLWVSDDGSGDGTPEIVAAFAAAHPVSTMSGPRRGAAQNFLSMLAHPDLPCGPVAFADQDDIWLAPKLARARMALAKVPPHQPALYAAASLPVDAALRPLGRPRSAAVGPSFGNALVQNLFSGHTMALNATAVALARRAGAPASLRYHDWWLYQLIAGAGGRLLLDPQTVALYRQHGGNALGAARGPHAAIRRLAGLVRGDWQAAMQAHAQALRQAEALLTPAARTTLDAVLDGLPRGGLARSAAFRRHGLTRSTPLATLILQICAAAGRV